MEKFQNREEYKKWKEARTRPKQEPIEPTSTTAQPIEDHLAKVEEEKPGGHRGQVLYLAFMIILML